MHWSCHSKEMTQSPIFKSRLIVVSQSASLPSSNLTPDEQKALKRLKTDEDIVILPADKGRVTVVIDRTDCNDKMKLLVNQQQTDVQST